MTRKLLISTAITALLALGACSDFNIEAGAEVEAGRPALIRDGGEWWVRRCYPTGEYLSLESLTGQGAPIVRAIHRVELLGALVALWRLYDF